MICDGCKREFPQHLIQPFEAGTFVRGEEQVEHTILICAICAYKLMNLERGLPSDTPPPKTAPKARKVYRDTVRYLKGKMQ